MHCAHGLQKLLLTVGLAVLGGCGPGTPDEPPPPEIGVVEVEARDVFLTQDFVGQTIGSVYIPIRSRVQGFLESREFEEGKEVKKGQLLYTIDPSPFLAQVVEAEGMLAEARTQLAKSLADLERIRPLAEMNAVSKQDLDAAIAQRDAAEGAVQAAEAQLELANIELGYTKIYAPIDGLIGISEAEVGEFVGSANTAVLNYVSLSDPIRVQFAVNEREYLRYARRAARLKKELGPQNAPDGTGEIQIVLADGSVHEYPGHIVAADAAIDPATGTFTLQAEFSNPDSVIIAGQFALARVVVDHRESALLVPQRAVSELQGVFRALVVDAQGVVQMRRLELGPEYERYYIVESGLKVGERVAVEGLLRLKDGMKVLPRPVALEQPASTGGG